MLKLNHRLWIIMSLIGLMFYFQSCEKDDICEENTPKTPFLVINFFDFDNRDIPKAVTNLTLVAEEFLETENHIPLSFNMVSQIKIPLKINADVTTYYMTINTGNEIETLINTDKLTFQYNRQDVYISRACGFKTYFDFDVLNPILVSEAPTSPNFPTVNLWIKDHTFINTSINNDNEIHLHFFY